MPNFNDAIPQFTKATRNYADNFNQVNNMLLDNTLHNKEEIGKKATVEYVDNKVLEINQSITTVSDDLLNVKNKVDSFDGGLIDINNEIDGLKQSVSNGKTLIARAITDKGISTSPSDTFATMQQKIYQIQSGGDSQVIISYGFDNEKVGNGAGVISLSTKLDIYKGVYKIFWGGSDGEILTEYDPICELDLTLANYDSHKTTPFFCIPSSAKTLIAFKDDAIISRLTLPDNKLITSVKNYSFGLLSDIHINPETTDTSDSVNDFTKALSYFKNTQNVDMLLISGDIITKGTLAEMQKFREMVDAQTLPVYCCRGNHDTYGDCNLTNFAKYIEPNGLYFEKVLHGDTYIFFGLTMEDMASPYATYALDWLEERLEVHKNERVFLLQHIFIEPVGNVAGLYTFNDGLVNSEGTISRRYRDLMSKYRNVIFFSGHSHFEFSLEKFSDVANCSERTDTLCHRVHTPSGCKVRTCDDSVPPKVYYRDDSGEGYSVDVYDNFIVLKGFNVPNQRLVTNAQYILYTTPIEISSDETIAPEEPTFEYEYKTGFTTYELGSLSSTGADRVSSSSWRSGWIELNKNLYKSFKFPRGITYIRICIYDSLKQFIQAVPNDYENGASTPSGLIIDIPQLENATYIKFKAQGDMESIEFNGEKSNEAIVNEPLPFRPPTVPIPENVTYPVPDYGTEPSDKYQKAKWKALNFIKRQMNASNFFSPVTVEITEMFTGVNLVHGVIGGLNNPAVIQNKYISLDQEFDHSYIGKVSGKWHNNLKHPERYRVDVHLKSDVVYFVDSCDLNADNTWITYFDARQGYKHIELVDKETGLQVEYGYPVVDNYYVKIYVLGDVEYEQETCKIYLKDGKYQFFAKSSYKDTIWLAKVFDLDGNIVGMSSQYSNIKYGQLPSSYLVPPDDPNFDKDGNTALGQNGYLLNNRSFIYDVGLALLVFTKERDFEMCKKLMNRMQKEQKENGAFNFSYDNYIGQLFEDYIRTGSIGWLVWGMCYYALESGDSSYNEMIKKAGEWILSQQVIETSDPRYGLLKGGLGEYSNDYVYSPTVIEWCSTEHNCSTLQAINGLYKLTQDERYKTCSDLIVNALMTTLYDSTNGRFYQGIGLDGVDEAWAIDCLTWAGKSILTAGHSTEATKCKDTVLQYFKVDNVGITQSSDKEYYNKTYSLPSGVTASGFKPYHIGYNNPPVLLWTEGTLGAVALFKGLGMETEATKYIDEMIKLQECNNSTGGLIYTNATYASIPWEFHVWESVVSSAWLYLVLTDASILF